MGIQLRWNDWQRKIQKIEEMKAPVGQSTANPALTILGLKSRSLTV
jgi:hypothetical protein